VAVVVSLRPRHSVTGVWVRRLSVGFMWHLVHLNPTRNQTLPGRGPVHILSNEGTSDRPGRVSTLAQTNGIATAKPVSGWSTPLEEARGGDRSGIMDQC
jgi:hypothetical protein